MTEQPEKAFCASFPRVPSVSHASTRLSSREMIKVSTFPSFRKKEVSNVADLIHFCPLVAFFQKKEISRFSFAVVRGVLFPFPCLFLACFFVHSCKEGEIVLFFRVATTYLFRRKTRSAAKKKEERTTAKERARGRERVWWSFHIFIYS